MNRIPAHSSNIAEVGYDADTMILEIRFHSNSIYQYFDVPQKVYEELLHAESMGKFLHAQIKNVYRYVRL